MATKKFGVLASALALCVAALAPVAQGQDMGARRLVVRYKSEVSSQQQSATVAKFGLRERKHLRSRGLHVVELPSYADSGKAMASLRAQPEVESVVEDVRVHAFASPNDPFFYLQWDLTNTTDTDIDAAQGWDIRSDASSTVVAIVDSGIDTLHEDLAANLWTNPRERVNGRDDDGNGYVDDVHGLDCVNNDGDPTDDFGHGTHVAGTIGAVGNNGRGVAGVAWRTQLMALKVLDYTGSGWDSDIIECIDYAIAMKSRGVNVRVMNMSLGGDNYDPALFDAVRAAQSAGILTVAAAGNKAVNHAQHPEYPASFALDGVVAVAATDETGGLASFSSYGSDVEIAAPGTNIASTYPGNQYAYMQGTSMASPHVAGAAALLASERPGATVGELRARLLATADRRGTLGNAVQSGRLDLAALLSGAATPPPNNPPPTDPQPGRGTPPAVPFFGKKLAIADVYGKSSKLTMSAKDGAIQAAAPGNAGDPTVYGGRLIVYGQDSGEMMQLPLDASGWRFKKSGFAFKGMGCSVAFKSGSISVKCGSGVRFPLEAPTQGSMQIVLDLGAQRFCTEFGGDVTKDFGIGYGKKPSKGAFAASSAAAPYTCPNY